MLATLFRLRPSHAHLPKLGFRRDYAERLPLARLFQLHAQPHHLYDFQSGIPTSIQTTSLRQICCSNFGLQAEKIEIRHFCGILLF